jgi:ATP-dependent exoDNAse (exonuclease V) alpha subunit
VFAGITLPNGKQHNIERINIKFQIMNKAYVIRKQFSITLSYGITIHKSQGLSLKSAVIDIGNSIFSSGQTYVALSCLTSIEGLGEVRVVSDT